MYQFTTTSVINSNLDSNGTTTKFTGSATAFDVKRVNKFLVGNVVDVYKRPYKAGVKEVGTITIPTHTAGKVIRLVVDIRLAQKTNSEYASTYLYFKKPVTVEVIATGTAATDAAALIAELNDMKNRYGHSYITATSGGGAVITLTAKDNNQRFYSITSEEETDVTTIDLIEYVTKATGSVTTAGVVGFGDDEWMIRAVRIPTLDNTKQYAISSDEKPVLGGNYTQYTIRYSVTKDHDDGIVSGFDSVTTHVFYVISTQVSAFETALGNASLVFAPAITSSTGSLTLANDVTATLVAANTIGAPVWAIDADASSALVSLDASTGEVVTHATNDGTATVSATDALGNVSTASVVVA